MANIKSQKILSSQRKHNDFESGKKKQKGIFCNLLHLKIFETQFCDVNHCVKSVRIRNFSGPNFSVFGLNTEIS